MARRLPAIIVLASVLALPAAADGARSKKPRAFASCAALGDYARKHALRIVGPQGLPFRFAFPQAGPDRMPPMVGDDGMEPMPVASPPAEGVDYSGTNVQEQGVDEPDFVKTDGRRLYVADSGTVHVLDVADGLPKLVGSLKLRGFGHELLVAGDRLLALTTYYDDPVLQPHGEAEGSAYREPATRLFEIDVSDPTAPRLLNTLTVEGFYVSARLRESVARVIVSTPPSPWTVDPADRSGSSEDAEAAHRRAIRRTKVATWLPDGVLRDRVRDTRRRERIADCDDVRRPSAYSGPGALTVLTLDLSRGLEPLDSDSLMTDAQTIYASKRSLFVATQRWFDPAPDSDDEPLLDPGRFTTIHRFGIADPARAEYRATGQVRGFVLNQFSLSEHDDVLRVATTDQPPWRAGAESRSSESFVTVLEEDGRALRRVGRVGGLGRGERIYAVRFMGDVGYVVTFRQVDPLYALDLSDPRAPVVRGELKIPGFSSYLHPLAGDLLLGIGQAADEEGRTEGTQLSLFDVSDLTAPRRLHQRTLGRFAHSEAEHDHHAFLYWPPTKLSVVPLTDYGGDSPFSGAVGFEVDRDRGITELGRAVHEGEDSRYAPLIRRSLVVGGRLLTVSSEGVLSSALDTLEPVGFAQFAREAP